jgi:hypothetical protein
MPRDIRRTLAVQVIYERGTIAEADRNEAEGFRRLAEEAREVRDHHREALETIRQQQERLSRDC